MRVIWTPEAQQDRAEIWDYIVANNPRSVVRMDELFSEAAARLADHPKLGRVGQIAGTRELVPHENYRLVYEIHRETVWILAMVHTARQGTHIAELFAVKEEGHDEYVKAKVMEALTNLKNGGTKGSPKDEVHALVMGKVRLRLANKK